VETSKSGGTPDVPGDADGDVVSHASKGAVAHSGKGAVEQQVDDGISAVEKRKAPTLFSQRPGAPRAHGARREREMALAEESRWAADSENRAAAIFATKALVSIAHPAPCHLHPVPCHLHPAPYSTFLIAEH
jgi:hypothetical protein